MSNLKRRVAKLEDKTGANKPAPFFIVVDKSKGETKEASWQTYLVDHPDADPNSGFWFILGGHEDGPD